MAIEAAARGLGVVLESNVLIEDELASGKLVIPLPGLGLSAMWYWLVTPRGPPSRESVDLVRRWLIENARPAPPIAG
jgi:LysR family glycine cleavage system transcriptional activator